MRIPLSILIDLKRSIPVDCPSASLVENCQSRASDGAILAGGRSCIEQLLFYLSVFQCGGKLGHVSVRVTDQIPVL